MERILSKTLHNELQNHKIILIIGQRQVGKTTELKRLAEQTDAQYFDLEDSGIRELLENPSLDTLERLFGDRHKQRILLLDEIQYAKKAGSWLKLLHDHFPNTKVFASGSASFLLLKDAGDSLLGRSLTYHLFPVSIREAIGAADKSYTFGKFTPLKLASKAKIVLEEFLTYGGLPEILTTSDFKRKEQLLESYIQGLLYKDIFEIEGIRNPKVFKKLLLLLSLQIGQEVNFNELATQLEISRPTVIEYIHLYEKFQILYSISSYSTNHRKEISKGFKIYFVDIGIRNALIENFAPIEKRIDKGALFENFICNLFYYNKFYYHQDYTLYFWRNYGGAEVDLVLESKKDNTLLPIEIKWNKTTPPSSTFTELYREKALPGITITKDNFYEFI